MTRITPQQIAAIVADVIANLPDDVTLAEDVKPKARTTRKAATAKRRRSVTPKASLVAEDILSAERTFGKDADVPKPSSRKRTARKPSARKVSTVAKSAIAVEPGTVTTAKPKGRSKPSAKQTVRTRFTLSWTTPDGETFTSKRSFRFLRKAEAQADFLRNRGCNVTIQPNLVAFARKPKASQAKAA